jgi:hypothetical protein
MSSCHPPPCSKIFELPKSKWTTLDLTNLVKVMLYAMFYKTAVWTPEEMIGKKMQNAYDKLPVKPKKATFFGDQPVRNAPFYEAYLCRTYQMMRQANEIVSGLVHQKGGYLPFICKICELFGVPPEVLEIKTETTTVSKVVELLQYLRHRSQTFNDWTIACLCEETLKNMKQYRRLLRFLQRVVTDRTFVLDEEEYEEFLTYLALLEEPIDISTFFSSLEGPHTERFMFTWIESLMVLNEMFDAIWIEDWHIQIANLDEVSTRLQKKLVKLWKFVHRRLSAEESMSENLLVFLCNVLPHLIKTKYFLLDEDLFYSVKQLVISHLETLTNEQYSILRCGKNENVSLFFPEDFQAFSIGLFRAVSCLHPDLHDVKNLQDDPDATLESLCMTAQQKAANRLKAVIRRTIDQIDYGACIDHFRFRSNLDKESIRRKAAIRIFVILRNYSRRNRAIAYARSLIPFLRLWDQISVPPMDVERKMAEIERRFGKRPV